MAFTEQEVRYLQSQRLARLASVGAGSQPDVAPVGFEFDGAFFYVAGMPLEGTRKYRNVTGGNDKVALVVDDVVSAEPWARRLIRVYGTARVVERDGRVGPGRYLQITPTVSWSSDLDGRPLPHPPDPSSRAESDEPFRPHKTLHRQTAGLSSGPEPK